MTTSARVKFIFTTKLGGTIVKTVCCSSECSISEMWSQEDQELLELISSQTKPRVTLKYTPNSVIEDVAYQVFLEGTPYPLKTHGEGSIHIKQCLGQIAV